MAGVSVKDANGAVIVLKSTEVGGEHATHHVIDSVSGNVNAVQSGAWAVSVSGITTSVVPGVGQLHLGKASGAAGVISDTGVAVLSVRQASPAAIAGANDRYQQITSDQNGRVHVQSAPRLAFVSRGGVDLEVKTAYLSFSGGVTDAALVAAVAGKKIVVVGMMINSGSSTDVVFRSKPAGAGTGISCKYRALANFAIQMPPTGLYTIATTNTGEGLSINTGTNPGDIQVWYIEE